MRTSLIGLLVAILCVGKVHSLWCYSCENVPSEWTCTNAVQCAESNMYCFSNDITTRKGENSAYKFSKGCSTNCTASSLNTGRTFHSTTCCTFDYCNSRGQLLGNK
ncbi:lymphocyte antigen 6E-like [Elgaria multicarinata webbii]|uniref:lymphocyte antigen 6E-like n=1 Tax=Elgaria multicarinata webbii TaxID=159646 RepID=UPI002FCD19CF